MFASLRHYWTIVVLLANIATLYKLALHFLLANLQLYRMQIKQYQLICPENIPDSKS